MALADLFSRPRLRAEALRGYRLERRTEVLIRAAMAAMEGGFVGVIADKIYHAPPLLIAVIAAAPMFGNLSSFLWAQIATGRRKVPIVTAIQTANIALIAVVGLIPSGELGAWMLTAVVVLSRLLLAGMVTVRSNVWTLNYPSEVRARITARLSLVGTAVMTLANAGGSLLLDADPEWFRWIYPASAALASIGILSFSRVPVVEEDRQLELERAPTSADAPRLGPIWILRNDPLYARYQLWQFVAGASNMLLETPLLLLVSQDLGASFVGSIAAMTVIPFGLSMVTLPLWANYIDRVHIAEFRARQGGLWVVSQAMVFAGAVLGSLEWVFAGRVVLGIARGGGLLAWNIGHNDFAPQAAVGQYMGVHVTLTGVRGAFAPFLGVLLYTGWSEVALPAGLSIPGADGIGANVFALGMAMSVVAALGFIQLARTVARTRKDP